MLAFLGKVVGARDALYSTIHGYAGTITTFCVGTAAIVRHSALLSTQLSLYSAVGVSTDFFSAVQALLGRLPTAGTCAALHVAARVYAGIFFFLCTCSDSYCPLQSVYYSSRRYCASQLLIVQVGISPFDAVLGGKQPFYSAVGVHTFSTVGLGIMLPFFKAVDVVVTRGHRSIPTAISTTVDAIVPL